jgi:hypothetical protein
VSQIYLVVALRNDEVEMCEAFFAVPLALGRAFQVATNMAGYNISTSPGEETMPDGSTCWTFLNTAKHKVKVFLREIMDSLPSQKDPMSFLGGLSNTKDVPKDMAPTGGSLPSLTTNPSAWVQPLAQAPIHQPPPPAPYDFMDRSLPAGWFQDGKPALMSDLLDNPFMLKSPLWDLTEEQKWALIEVRVRKSPGFHSPIGTLDQGNALAALKGRTAHGLMLRDEEIEALHALREDQMAGTH